jgi:Uma2 family endonuclease
MTATIVVDDVELEIPSWVKDLASFREWVDDPSFPDKVPVWWLRGKVWADMSREQLFTHNLVRTAITSVLFQIVANEELGIVWSDGAFLSNKEANIGGKPDLVFCSHDSLASGRTTLVEGADGGPVEVQGTPDVVLEVISKSSVTKGKRDLFESYWAAGIPEYWLVDARRSPLIFEIYKHTPDGYISIRKRDGWIKSNVFGRSFRLIAATDRSRLPTYKLELR